MNNLFTMSYFSKDICLKMNRFGSEAVMLWWLAYLEIWWCSAYFIMSFYIAVLVVAFSVDWFKFALFRNVVGNKSFLWCKCTKLCFIDVFVVLLVIALACYIFIVSTILFQVFFFDATFTSTFTAKYSYIGIICCTCTESYTKKILNLLIVYYFAKATTDWYINTLVTILSTVY